MRVFITILLFSFAWNLQAQCPWTSSVTSQNGSFTLTCSDPTLNILSSNNNTNSVTYFWTGPGFSASTPSVNLNQVGSYTLVVTDVVTSCSVSQNFAVSINTTSPSFSLSPSSVTVSCLVGSATFTATAITPTNNFIFEWYAPQAPFPLGPPAFTTSTSPSLFPAFSTGAHVIIAKDISNGCTTLQTFTAMSNSGFPTFSVTSANGFSLGCNPTDILTITNVMQTNTSATSSYSFLPPGSSASPPLSPGMLLSPTSSMVISAPGTYTLVVQDDGNFCQTAISVPIVQSTVGVNFTNTVSTGGQVNFQSTSTGTNAGTTYTWDFGDGTTGNGISAAHTYSNGGIHNVILQTNNPNCSSLPTTVNVNTLPCNAISTFTLVYSGTPQSWLASPSYYGNVINAVWNWGDGSSTNAMYPSHTYSAAGLYNICLSVTVSCANTTSTCTNYNIFKVIDVNQQMVNVSVVSQIPVGLKDNLMGDLTLSVFPNPASDILNIECSVLNDEDLKISIFNNLGQLVKQKEILFTSRKGEIDVKGLAQGVYTISILTKDNYTINKRVVISR